MQALRPLPIVLAHEWARVSCSRWPILFHFDQLDIPDEATIREVLINGWAIGPAFYLGPLAIIRSSDDPVPAGATAD